MLRMLGVFFVWEVEGFCVLGLTLNVAAFSLPIRGMLTHWTTLLYIFVTIKCLGIVVLSLATQTGKQSQFRMGNHAVVVLLCKKNKIYKKN